MAEARYRFAPGGPKAVVLGLSAAQLVILGAGSAAALGAVMAHTVALGLVAGGLAVAIALVPLAGRPAYTWAGPGTAHLLVARRRPAPLTRHHPRRATKSAPSPLRLPDGRRVRFEAADGAGLARIGRHHSFHYSFTLEISGPALSLAEPEAHEATLGAWGEVLAGAARRGLRRLVLIEQLGPQSPNSVAAWANALAGRADPAALSAYRAHLSAVVGSSRVHRLYLSGSAASAPDAAAQAQWLAQALTQAGFPNRRLVASELAEVTRRILAPGSEHPAPQPSWHSAWDRIGADGATHVVFEAAELPRIPVPGPWLAPMVNEATLGTARVVALQLELTPPEEAIRRAEREALSGDNEAELRARLGFRFGARQALSAQASAEREAELAGGQPEMNFSLLVGLAVEHPSELDVAAAGLVAAGARAGLRLRRCYGRQPQALSGLVPVVVSNGGGRP